MKTLYFSRQSLQILYLIVFLGALSTVILLGLWQKQWDLTTFNTKTELTRASENYNDDRKTQLKNITADKTSTKKVQPMRPKKRVADGGTDTASNRDARKHLKSTPDNCKGCSKLFSKILKDFSLNWTKNEENHLKLRSLLINSCNGFQRAFVTQTNTPLGTTIVYDWEKRSRKVTEDLFNNFPKVVPFSDKMLHTCAVVGNGGILANSSCGETIDSAQFVIRCNLPPIENSYSKHVGRKTSLVTANPSIFRQKYAALLGRRRAFVDSVSIYGDSLLFLPAFARADCTSMSMTVHYTLEDFRSSVKAVFMNPDYLISLDKFWRSQGVNLRSRMSSGFMMVSLALEICNNVDVYGFWPFDYHPYGFQSLTHHYYDNDKHKRSPHAMPAEFAHLIKLHNQGVLNLHLGECPPQQ